MFVLVQESWQHSGNERAADALKLLDVSGKWRRGLLQVVDYAHIARPLEHSKIKLQMVEKGTVGRICKSNLPLCHVSGRREVVRGWMKGCGDFLVTSRRYFLLRYTMTSNLGTHSTTQMYRQAEIIHPA